MTPGRFISLEGGEGAGKSTQVARLAAALDARGLEAVTTREPGGSPGAEAIRGLLMTGEVARWDARTEALLFAAARADHVATVIRPAITRGAWVVCDRFVDSTRAYQGAAGLDDGAIMALHRFGSDGLLPDRTIVLEIAAEAGLARAAARDGGAHDRFARRDEGFHAEVAATFRRIAARESGRVRRVDAGGTAEAVTERILAEIADLLP